MRLRLAAIAAVSLLIGSVGGSSGARSLPGESGGNWSAAPTPAPVFANELEAAGSWPSPGATAEVEGTAEDPPAPSPPALLGPHARFRRSVPVRSSAEAAEADTSEESVDHANAHTAEVSPHLPQTVGVNVRGAQLIDDSLYVPPDSMGAVGPEQFLLAVNGRIRTFTKAGSPDGVLNTSLEAFFGDTTGVCDPRVRYDRHADRWFVVAINHCQTGAPNNQILIAVSDEDVITAADWKFYAISADTGTFNDFPTLGIDEDALYIGANVFEGFEEIEDVFIIADSHAYVVRKSSVLSGGTIVFTKFANLLDPATFAGLVSPQGVDNFTANTNEGYFIAIDGQVPGRLDLRRVSDPGGTPSISSTIVIPTDDMALPVDVPQPAPGPELDGFPAVFLSNAVIRNGRLWTSHSIGVDSSGTVPPLSSPDRNGARWYELRDLSTTPSVVQSGTVFDSTSTNPLNYWMSSVMVSGQGHAAVGFSRAGANPTNGFASAATAGRLRTDAAGAMRTPTVIQGTTFLYNPIFDPSVPKRWGDYSATSLDPNDDMTMWTVQEYTSAPDRWGVRIAQLRAPAPTISGGLAPPNTASASVSIVGTGFFEPGEDFPNHLEVSASGGITVNDITSVTPSQVVVDLNTTGVVEGEYDITITNPDGQQAQGKLTVSAAVPDVTVSPLTLAFGDVVVATTSAARTVTVENSGTVPVSVGNVELGGTAETEFAKGSDTCSGATLAAAATCTVQVTFEPASIGLKNATLAIATSASTQPEVVTLTGTGVAAAATPTPTPTPTSTFVPTPLTSPPVTVLAAASTAQPTRLPVTGANIGDLLRAALLFVAVGAGLVVASRRRSATR